MSKRFGQTKGVTQRQLRVGELIRRELADLLAQGAVRDPDLPNVSITVGEVRLSSDLRKATVYVLPLGGRYANETISALNREKSEIRRMLNRRIHLKFSPELNFVYDTSFDQMDELRRLLDLDDVKRDLSRRTTVQEG